MEILYYRDPSGNFGDDLNEMLWHRLLPKYVFDFPGVALMGVGSIFNAARAPSSMTQGKRVFVIGSGAGYGPLPSGWQEWDILAARGPLTAELIGRPDVAATDGAALLSLFPDLITLDTKQDEILLIPHHYSAAKGQWGKVAAELGFTYVDPRWSVDKVLGHLSRAKLVITEAMHGAIVADTMRIPWIPILIAPDALPFKWRDWTLSLGLQYEATRIPASSMREVLYHRDLNQRAKASKVVAPVFTKDLESRHSLIADFQNRYKSWSPESAPVHPRSTKSVAIRKTLISASTLFDGFYIENAVKALRRLNLDKHYLSEKSVLDSRVEQLNRACLKLAETLRS
jgi:succinoglycan biosynthesis protein ExoV